MTQAVSDARLDRLEKLLLESAGLCALRPECDCSACDTVRALRELKAARAQVVALNTICDQKQDAIDASRQAVREARELLQGMEHKPPTYCRRADGSTVCTCGLDAWLTAHPAEET